MIERPTASELLDVARRTVLDDLVAALPSEKRYSALMVAAAMAIAGREIVSGARAAEEEAAALSKLLGAGDSEQSGVPAALADLRRQFADRLRQGGFDADPGAALAALRQSVLARLRISDPDYPGDR